MKKNFPPFVLKMLNLLFWVENMLLRLASESWHVAINLMSLETLLCLFARVSNFLFVISQRLITINESHAWLHFPGIVWDFRWSLEKL